MSNGTAIELVLRCGAKTRRGAMCRQIAGARTDHVGQGKCWLHGGATPIRHGRYSKIQRPRLRELIAEHEADPDPLNLQPELAALRALFTEFIERYDVQTEALLAWHASFQLTRRPLPEDLVLAFERIVDDWEDRTREGAELTEAQTAAIAQARKFLDVLRGGTAAAKPHTVLDLTDAYRVLDAIGKMVERIEKGRKQMTFDRVERLIRLMANDVDDVLPRDEQHVEYRKQIRERWRAIQV